LLRQLAEVAGLQFVWDMDFQSIGGNGVYLDHGGLLWLASGMPGRLPRINRPAKIAR
jgi:hypothetical protein